MGLKQNGTLLRREDEGGGGSLNSKLHQLTQKNKIIPFTPIKPQHIHPSLATKNFILGDQFFFHLHGCCHFAIHVKTSLR